MRMRAYFAAIDPTQCQRRSTASRAGAAASVPEAVRQLTDARQALLATLDGIDEESFYRLGTIGRQEYSVLSVLENSAHHDREHAQQIRSIVATA